MPAVHSVPCNLLLLEDTKVLIHRDKVSDRTWSVQKISPSEVSTSCIQGTTEGVEIWQAGEQTYLDIFFTVCLLVKGQLTF